MAREADDLLADARELPVLRTRPPPLHRGTDQDHRPAVFFRPLLHQLQRAEDVVEVVAVLYAQDVPAIGGPLLRDVVALVLGLDHAAYERVVDARVVLTEQNTEAFADLLGKRCGLELLGMSFGHGELALEGHDLHAGRCADEVPERRLARRGGDPDTRRTSVHVVGHVGTLGVPHQGPDTAQLCLLEQRVVGEAVVLEQRGHGRCVAPKSQGVDGQNRDVGVAGVPVVPGVGVPPSHRLVQDHPQRVARRDAVSARQHELVAEGVLGRPDVVGEPAGVGAPEVQRHVVRRVGQRATEVA